MRLGFKRFFLVFGINYSQPDFEHDFFVYVPKVAKTFSSVRQLTWIIPSKGYREVTNTEEVEVTRDR